ncbi:META domain-containing protein [Streptomyces sp. NPDC057555]|uniref:META domain-containing protein n=1 Tax=Streptomyces sp. NPDC057555 TaxID=3346166 RepID=UPI003689737E
MAALLTLTACSAAPERVGGAKKHLGGPGDVLVGAVLGFDGGEVDGQKIESPPPTPASRFLRNWVEFHDDGTVSGTYGCTPFRLTADVRATELALTKDGPQARTEGCPRTIAAFEKQVKKVFTGRLTMSERKVDPAQQERTVDLKNEHGDYLSLSVTRPAEGFFGTKWVFYFSQYDDGGQYGGPPGVKISWIFHEDGTLTGRLACNDFKARAHFTGKVVTLSSATLTTHRKCNGLESEDESWLETAYPYSYVVSDAETRLTLRPQTTGVEPSMLYKVFKRAGSP